MHTCPHCKQKTFSTYKVLFRPQGRNLHCPVCGGTSSIIYPARAWVVVPLLIYTTTTLVVHAGFLFGALMLAMLFFAEAAILITRTKISDEISKANF